MVDIILVSWLIIAVVCFVGEIINPQFFLLWFGIGAVVALVSHFLGVVYPYQWAVFAIVSIAGILATRPFAKLVLKEEPEKSSTYRLIGQTMRVTKTIDNVKGNGQVQWRGEYWRAISEDGSIIEEGRLVRVIRIEGVSIVVKTVKEEVG